MSSVGPVQGLPLQGAGCRLRAAACRRATAAGHPCGQPLQAQQLRATECGPQLRAAAPHPEVQGDDDVKLAPPRLCELVRRELDVPLGVLEALVQPKGDLRDRMLRILVFI